MPAGTPTISSPVPSAGGPYTSCSKAIDDLWPDTMDCHLLGRSGTSPAACTSVFVSKLGRSFLAFASELGNLPRSGSSARFQ
jgi:hypothetical protein